MVYPNDYPASLITVEDVAGKFTGDDVEEVLTEITGLISSGWSLSTETFTYASASTITIATGGTARWQIGDMIKLTQHGSVKYFYVVLAASTLLTVRGETSAIVIENTTTYPITAINFSRGGRPYGFPRYFTYTTVITAQTGTPTTVTSTMQWNMTGGKVFLTGFCTVTDKGTASDRIYLTVPIITALASTGASFEQNATGLPGIVTLFSSQAYLSLRFADGSTMWVNGYGITFSLQYFI
jgi:hypothetical protein